MTIVIGAASPDGIVLAADSRTTVTWNGSDRHRIATDSAEKVFSLHDRFAVATYGMASMNGQTINGIMNEFVASQGDGCDDVASCAKALGEFFTERFNAAVPEFDVKEAGGWPLGFVVAGYDSAGVGHVWEVQVPGAKLEELDPSTREGGTLWRGQIDVVLRLIKGVDYISIGASGVTFDKAAMEALAKFEYILMTPATLQDAADLTAFLVRTTIDMQRASDRTALAPGSIPGCGGAIQMLAVTPSGTQWINRRWYVGPGPPGSAEGAFD